MSVALDLAHSTATTAGLRLRASAAEATVVRYDVPTHTLTLDTTTAGYGDAVVPMDDALARAAVDLGGRPFAERSALRL